MAGGYLGKISAVVAANTGDYVRKLNDSASQTKAFARTISSDLSRASREASRSIESILTPLQRFERAIQNAASRKLAFRGFDGAIETVEQLQKAIAKVSGKPVELAFLLKESGLKTLEQIRQTIGSISEKNLQLAVSVGGVEGLRRLRAEVSEVDGKLVNVAVKTDATELDRLIEVFSQISPERVRELKVAVETRQLEQAVTLNKQLVSVATEITSAYGKAKQQFAGFSAEAQIALGPGLRSADAGILKVLEDIEARIPITEQRFASLGKAARDAIQSIGRLGEADRAAQALSGGQNLGARRQDAATELSRAQASQQSAGGLSNAADLFARQKAAAEALVVELGKMEAAELQIGGGVKVTTKEYERQLGVLRAITTQIEQSAAARGNADRVNAVISGSPQNFDQGRALQGQLESQISTFNRSQRQDFKGLLTQANDLSVGDRPENLEKYLDVLQKIQFEVAKKFRINVDTDNAQADAERLRSTLESLQQRADFVVTGRPQNLTQVQSELDKILGTLDRASDDQRSALRPNIEQVNVAVASGQLDAANEALDELRANAANAVTVTVNATQALSRIDAINEAWDQAIRQVPNSAEAIDSEFNSILSSVSNLGIADRLNLDPLIAAFRDSVAAGEPLIAQFQRLLELRQRLNERADIPVSEQPQSIGQSTNLAGGRARERMQAAREFLGTDRPSPVAVPRDLSQLGSQINSIRSQIDALPVSLRGGLFRELVSVQDQFVRVSGSIRPSVAELQRLEQAVSRVAANAKRVNLSNSFRANFGGAGTAGVTANLNESALKGYSAQLELLQSTIGRASAAARGPAVQAFARLRDAIAEAMRDGTINTSQAQQRIELFRQSAIKAAAAAAGIGAGGLDRKLARVGDVARGSFGNVGLAVQQAAFAFEDFFSVTGGLDQRIRAAGNNISQLGFILGGTTGLIAGISIALGSQLIAAIIKWTGATEDAEKKQRDLKASLESANSSLDKQRQLVEGLRDTYKELAKSIAESGAPESFRNERERRGQVESVQRDQEGRRRAGIEAISPQIIARRAQIAEIDRRLETEQNPAARQRLIGRRDAATRAIEREASFVESRAATNARAALNFNPGFDAAIADQLRRRGGVVSDIGRATRRNDGAEADRLGRELAVIDTTIRRLRDAAARISIGRSQDIIGGVNRAQAAIENVPGIRQLDAVFGTIRTELERAATQFADGQISFQELSNQQGRLAEVGTNAEQAAQQLGEFSQALQDAASSLARDVEQEMTSRAASQRRAANAAEARFGADDPRTLLARRQQQQSEELARRATLDRENIDAQISRERQRFESDAMNGRGDPVAARIGERLREIERELATPATTTEGARAQEGLRLEATTLRRQLGDLFSDSPVAAELRQRANEADVRAQEGVFNQEAVRRGLEASITPAQRAADELAGTISDLKAALDDGIVNQESYNAAVQRNTEDQARQVAPLLLDFRDERLNAALQGPSRAALNVTDAQTVDGARELNRLLRGDDPAKDANLAELQKQTGLLEELVNEAKQKDAVVDIRG